MKLPQTIGLIVVSFASLSFASLSFGQEDPRWPRNRPDQNVVGADGGIGQNLPRAIAERELESIRAAIQRNDDALENWVYDTAAYVNVRYPTGGVTSLGRHLAEGRIVGGKACITDGYWEDARGQVGRKSGHCSLPRAAYGTSLSGLFDTDRVSSVRRDTINGTRVLVVQSSAVSEDNELDQDRRCSSGLKSTIYVDGDSHNPIGQDSEVVYARCTFNNVRPGGRALKRWRLEKKDDHYAWVCITKKLELRWKAATI